MTSRLLVLLPCLVTSTALAQEKLAVLPLRSTTLEPRVTTVLDNLLVATIDESGGYAPVGKTFKGLTDKQFIEMTARLQAIQLSDDGYTVAVRPEVVVEVTYNEIQRSPQYSSEFALRFARITRIRADKDHSQITTLTELRSLYERQFLTKSRR